jgi:hypothetical protein
MPTKSNIMTDQAISILKEKYGTEFGVDAVKEVAAELGTSYATLSKYLNQYKTGRGKWNLEATVQLSCCRRFRYGSWCGNYEFCRSKSYS